MSLTLTPDNDLSAEKNPSAAAAELKERAAENFTKFDLNNLEKSITHRDEADFLKLEDSSSCDLASRTSF